MKMDMSQYLDVFLEESKDHLRNLNASLLNLEKNPRDNAGLNEIFRAAHTLKGMSSTMGFNDLADLTHHMENVLSDLKEGLLEANSYVVDTLFECVDRLQIIIDGIESGTRVDADNSELIMKLETIKSGNYEAAAVLENELPTIEPGESTSINDDNVFSFNEYDITVMKEALSNGYSILHFKIGIDPDCMMKAVRAFMVFKTLEEDGEIIKTNPSAQDLDEGKFDKEFDLVLLTRADVSNLADRINNVSEVKVMASKTLNLDALLTSGTSLRTENKSEVASSAATANDADNNKKAHKIKQTVRVDIDRLDNLMNLVGELVMHKGRLEQIGATHKVTDLNETIEQIDRISTDLQSVVMKVRMVPIEQVFNRFPRMVRDLAKELDKEVDFLIEGKETELDRTVIDEIGDPLVHLLRNALDHGLESSSERVAKGKPRQGNLILRARHEGNNVYIEVEDDGAGIDQDKVIGKALEKGLITAKEAENLTREESINLLFLPGFSTANNVTDVSGRGVGLDVVKTKIESLNGEINVDSRPGQGTMFRIKLPLTLAIIQALMVSVKDEIYAIPLTSVDETTMITKQDIKMIQSQEVIMLRGNVLPLFRLARLIDLPDDLTEDAEMYVVVVRKGDRQIGLVVDTLIGQQEIVIKALGKILAGISGIAGAIVAGDGNVRLILDITTLF
ncbi:Signal transduction histidine kinase, core [Syntrophomonas zehnderi OL-4]|uniref:Chemotaxis protein CheA n=2 Tax=Syntrophomonas TaxID=862 RepID=A0A0E4GAV4_9FIRM|nr:Signal transduction histidine kinase, core [Syntrophomonas zehnderi OL-4]